MQGPVEEKRHFHFHFCFLFPLEHSQRGPCCGRQCKFSHHVKLNQRQFQDRFQYYPLRTRININFFIEIFIFLTCYDHNFAINEGWLGVLTTLHVMPNFFLISPWHRPKIHLILTHLNASIAPMNIPSEMSAIKMEMEAINSKFASILLLCCCQLQFLHPTERFIQFLITLFTVYDAN